MLPLWLFSLTLIKYFQVFLFPIRCLFLTNYLISLKTSPPAPSSTTWFWLPRSTEIAVSRAARELLINIPYRPFLTILSDLIAPNNVPSSLCLHNCLSPGLWASINSYFSFSVINASFLFYVCFLLFPLSFFLLSRSHCTLKNVMFLKNLTSTGFSLYIHSHSLLHPQTTTLPSPLSCYNTFTMTSMPWNASSKMPQHLISPFGKLCFLLL